MQIACQLATKPITIYGIQVLVALIPDYLACLSLNKSILCIYSIEISHQYMARAIRVRMLTAFRLYRGDHRIKS